MIFCFTDADYFLPDAKFDEVGVDVSLRHEEDPYLSTEMGDSDQCQDSNAETSCPQLSAVAGIGVSQILEFLPSCESNCQFNSN